MDERTLQAAAAALEKGWLELATERELVLLDASGERPELFEDKDPGEIRILLAFDAVGDGIGPTTIKMQTPEAGTETAPNVAEFVFRRTRLRSRLGLPANDCGAKRPNQDCSCLTRCSTSRATRTPTGRRSSRRRGSATDGLLRSSGEGRLRSPRSGSPHRAKLNCTLCRLSRRRLTQ